MSNILSILPEWMAILGVIAVAVLVFVVGRLRRISRKLGQMVEQRTAEILEQQQCLEKINNELQETKQRLQLEQRSFLERLMVEATHFSGEDILCLGFSECLRQTPAHTGLIYIEHWKNIFVPIESYGVPLEQKRKSRYRLGEGIVGQIAANGEALYYENNREEHDIEIDDGFAVYPPPCVMFIPILYRGKTKAVIALGSVSPFSDYQKEICMTIAHQTSIGYDNASKTEILRLRTKKIEKQNKEIVAQKQSLQKMNEELQELARHKGEFLASMSHELRTPLNAMIGYTSLSLKALQGEIPKKQLQNLVNAEQSARILLQLINDILDFSKIEAGMMEVFLEEFSLEEMAESCMITAQGLLLDKPVELRCEVADIVVQSDYTRLEQIINNLLSNAIKFTEKGHISIRTCNHHKGTIGIEVEDTGCGIPEDKLNNIFEEFKQIDSSITKRFGGTGLGLAISRKLCEMLAIEIAVKSQEGKGTTFSLTIPLRHDMTKRKIEILQPPRIGTMQRIPTINRILTEGEKEAQAMIACLTSDATVSSLSSYIRGIPLRLLQVHSIEQCRDMAKKSLWAIIFEPQANDCTFAQLAKEINIQSIPIILYTTPADDKQYPGIAASLQHPMTKEAWLQALWCLIQFYKQSRTASIEEKTVLVVDDNEMNLQLIETIFAEAGYTVYIADSGKAAIKVAEAKQPDIVLMDLAMPEMDGFEATRRLKASPRTMAAVVIACSAFTSKDFQERAQSAGCEGYIAKPIEPRRLLEQVKKSVLAAKIQGMLHL